MVICGTLKHTVVLLDVTDVEIGEGKPVFGLINLAFRDLSENEIAAEIEERSEIFGSYVRARGFSGMVVDDIQRAGKQTSAK